MLTESYSFVRAQTSHKGEARPPGPPIAGSAPVNRRLWQTVNKLVHHRKSVTMKFTKEQKWRAVILPNLCDRHSTHGISATAVTASVPVFTCVTSNCWSATDRMDVQTSNFWFADRPCNDSVLMYIFSHVVRFPLIYDLVLAIFLWQSCFWYHFNCEWKLHLTMVKSSVSPLRVKYKKVFSSFFNLFGDNYTLYVKYNYKRWSTVR